MEYCGLHVLESIETEFEKLIENPEIYVEPQPEKVVSFKELSERSYSSVLTNNKNCKGRFLPKLLIDGFDEEQIWQQCDLLNKAALSNISQTVHGINCKDIFHAITKSNKVPLSSADKTTSENEDAFSNFESSAEDEYAFDDDSDSPAEMEAVVKKKPAVKEKKKYNCSVVDDQFFKLTDLEQFLKIEDLKEEKGIEKDSEDDDIDLFQDILSDYVEDFDGEEVKSKKSSGDIMYEDFFDDPDSEVGDESDDNMDYHGANMMEKNDDASLDGSNSNAEIEDGLKENDRFEVELDKSEENINVQKTAFELEQEKIKGKIQEYEKSLIEPLPWHLTGEVDATNRPSDSLIHKETDFDCNVKEDLIVDNTLTESIERIVRMAIMNKAFNDVERKYKPTEKAFKKNVLEQTKSKKSLAEVYEEDYMKKQNKQNYEEEEDSKHKEIKKLMDSLFPELYGLFSHIPMPAIPEIKVISNLPAATVEEVAPCTMSDAMLLAPEEVKKKSGLIKGQTERTETDRKRERRKKKVHQRLKEKERLEKVELQKRNPSAKMTKLEKLQTLKKLKQHKNTKIATVDDGGKIKSSKDFFSRLQDNMNSKRMAKS